MGNRCFVVFFYKIVTVGFSVSQKTPDNLWILGNYRENVFVPILIQYGGYVPGAFE